MDIDLKYGRDGLRARLPEAPGITVLGMNAAAPVNYSSGAITLALRRPTDAPPLAEHARGSRTAAITISDVTRPVPNAELLPPILDELNAAGIPDSHILIVVGTGLHRPNTTEELRDMVGPEVLARCEIINHDARDAETLKYLGDTSRGTPIWLNKRFVETDLKIATSLIEPHLMAGFSGGRKAVCPGLAGLETMRTMHGARLLAHPNAREGVLDGNPFHEEATEIARRAGVDFIVAVALDEARRLTAVFAGDLEAAHAEGCAFVGKQVTAYVDEPVDAVITTSAGHPLDLTFYQSVKAMTAATPILKDGGTCLVASRCAEGIGSPEFTKLMFETRSVEEFRARIEEPDFFVVDQWQLQEMCRALDRGEVWYFSDGLSDDDLRRLLVTPVASIEEGVARFLDTYGPEAKIAVIPEGPYIMPRVRGQEPD